jgi:hypothetical protein
MNDLQPLLAELENLLTEIDAPVMKRLNTGIDLRESFKDGVLQLPCEVEELYKWKNGITPFREDRIGTVRFVSGMIFMSMEEAVGVHQVMSADKLTGWDFSQFPIFYSGGGEFLLIDCDPNSASYKMLLFHSIGAIDFDTIITQYDSLHSMFTTINECFRRKIYQYEDEMLDSNYDLEFELSRTYNSSSAYWKLYDV